MDYISPLLKLLIASISNQSDVLTASSVAGLTGVGILFRHPRAFVRLSLLRLAPVLVLFLTSLLCGYLIKMLITGYFHEMAHGTTSESCPSDSSTEYFICDYSMWLRNLVFLQLLTGIIGYFWLTILWLKVYYVKPRKAPE